MEREVSPEDAHELRCLFWNYAGLKLDANKCKNGHEVDEARQQRDDICRKIDALIDRVTERREQPAAEAKP